VASRDFELSMDELRIVAGYVAQTADDLLPVFEDAHPGDPRPRAAVAAAWRFVHGEPRAMLQRVTSVDAHRAARQASSETARRAAQAAGDAAAAAYLHPIASAYQVGHILRAAANAARVQEIATGDPAAAIVTAQHRASPTLIDILRRYPPAPGGKNRVAQLMATLDAALRAQGSSAS
jgi:hypothetical protein